MPGLVLEGFGDASAAACADMMMMWWCETPLTKLLPCCQQQQQQKQQLQQSSFCAKLMLTILGFECNLLFWLPFKGQLLLREVLVFPLLFASLSFATSCHSWHHVLDAFSCASHFRATCFYSWHNHVFSLTCALHSSLSVRRFVRSTWN